MTDKAPLGGLFNPPGEARRLSDKMNGNQHRTADFSYRAVEAW